MARMNETPMTAMTAIGNKRMKGRQIGAGVGKGKNS